MLKSVVVSSEEMIDFQSWGWDFFFFINPKYSAEKSCPLAVTEQNFSKYFAEMFIFDSIALLINRSQCSKSNDKFTEGSEVELSAECEPESGNFPSTFGMFFFKRCGSIFHILMK